jgi:hypothetical protein
LERKKTQLGFQSITDLTAMQKPLLKSMFVVAAVAVITFAFLAARSKGRLQGNLANNEPIRVTETSDYIVYMSGALDTNSKYPLVIAMSPSGDAMSMIREWKRVADKHRWILYASKRVRNGVPFDDLLAVLVPSIQSLPSLYPVDQTRTIATGLSGGAMMAHFLAYHNPELVSAVVANTGMIYSDESATLQDMLRNEQTSKIPYPKNKIAVFLASPRDFRYPYMKRDRLFLESLGWKTDWLEFEGGHTLAPDETVEKAADWLSQQLGKDIK